MERRLAAILAADVVGYSHLMELDEEGTVTRQKAHRRELIDLTISEHHAHIVKTTGDGLLVLIWTSPPKSASLNNRQRPPRSFQH